MPIPGKPNSPFGGPLGVSAAESSGNLQFRDNNGNVISTIDGTNRKITFPSGSTLDLPAGSILSQDGQTQQHGGVARVALAGGTDTGGGLGSWVNPFGLALVIDELVVVVTHIATAACNLDAGATASSATTLSDNLIDGRDVHTAAAPYAVSNYSDAGANGKSLQYLASGSWVTFSTGDSGASAGFTGIGLIYYTFAT